MFMLSLTTTEFPTRRNRIALSRCLPNLSLRECCLNDLECRNTYRRQRKANENNNPINRTATGIPKLIKITNRRSLGITQFFSRIRGNGVIDWLPDVNARCVPKPLLTDLNSWYKLHGIYNRSL